MYNEYEEMYRQVTERLLFIREASLFDDKLNNEWKMLLEVQNLLIRLIKNEMREDEK